MKKNIETKKKAATDLPELQAWQKLEDWQQPEAWPELKELQNWQTLEAQRNSNIENSKNEKESYSND